MQPNEKAAALRQNIRQRVFDVALKAGLKGSMALADASSAYEQDVNRIFQAFATYLEGADILPEKRPKRKVKNELDSIADYVDQGFNQAIDTTAANLASVIKSLRGTK